MRTFQIGVSVGCGGKMSDESREYPRVPGLDEIDHHDFVALRKAREQQTRDRYKSA